MVSIIVPKEVKNLRKKRGNKYVMRQIREVGVPPIDLTAEDIAEEKRDITNSSTYKEKINKVKKELKHSGQGFQGKKGWWNGVHFDSMWECIYYRYQLQIRFASVDRNTTKYFSYMGQDAKVHKFYPDFLCNGQYVEVKGIIRPADQLKMNACPQVKFVFGDEIKQMRKDLEAKYPNWKKEFLAGV